MAKKDKGFDADPLAMGGSNFKPTPAEEQPSVEAIVEALQEPSPVQEPGPEGPQETQAPAAPAPTTGIDPLAVMDRLASAIESLSKRQDASESQNMGLMTTLTDALQRLSEATIQGANIQALEAKRAHRPSNEIYHGRSIFNRRGDLLEDYKKPRLKCMMLIPYLVEWESVTREEVELLNLLEAGTYMVKRVDNSKVKIDVIVSYEVDGKKPSRILVRHDTAFNNDNFNLFPPMTEWLRQVLRQHENKTIHRLAAAVLTDEEEEAMIEAGQLTVSQ